MKTVLVTGGAGYIGSHTCKALHRAGFHPVTYDNLSTGHKEAVKWGPLIIGDISDKRSLEQTIKTYQPVAVFHFAADALVLESQQSPAKYYRNNVEGTLSLLETMVECDLKALIFSSSCAIYGQPKSELLSEELTPNPINPYGRTKWMAELMMEDFDRAYGLKTIALRYFNAAGADSDGELGENHQNETHLIPRAIQVGLRQRDELVIYGDGSAVRDYTHVEDLAVAHVQALKHLLSTNKSDRFNLGTGIGTTILAILEAVEQISGSASVIRFEKKQDADPQSLVANAQKAVELLGWKPKLSDLRTIVASAYQWHQKLGASKQ